MNFFRALIFSIVASLFFIVPLVVLAQNEFSIDANVTYNVQDSGKTTVTHNITLENNFSTLYATTYSLNLENIDAQNISATDANGNTLQTDVQKSGDTTTIKVTFSDAVVGKGSQRHFAVSYDNDSFAVRTGEVWEVTIPGWAINQPSVITT